MSSKPPYSYDFECERLASFFLQNGKITPEEHRERVPELAQRIQDCIEEALEEWKNEERGIE